MSSSPTSPPFRNKLGKGTLKAGCASILAFLIVITVLTPRIPPEWPPNATGIAAIAMLIMGVGAAVVIYRAVKHVIRGRAERLCQEAETRRLEQERVERERRLTREDEIRRVAAAIDEHAAVLRTKRAQLRRPDEYGIIDEAPWLEHCDYFLGHVIERQFPDLSEAIQEHLPELIDMVLNHAEKGEFAAGHFDVQSMDGITYEHHCANILAANGWTTTVTKATGDQGVDVIARRGDIKLVVQCKRYSAPVGNKAVQEVIAAQQFEDATHAVVVSTAPYTDSARALAHKTGVYLISQEQLPQLWGLLTDSQ